MRRFHKAYLKKPEAEIDPALLPKGERVLAVMNDHLAKQRYFVDGKISLADIALVAYTRWADEGGFESHARAPCPDRISRVEQDLGLARAA